MNSLYNAYFQYKLIKDGVDVNWSEPFKLNEVNFKNLSTGKYIFNIRFHLHRMLFPRNGTKC